jgi:nucleoside-diphosphate-sugar epimerase
VRVVITGGGGFLGRTLATRLLTRGSLIGPAGRPERIESLVLLDLARPYGAQPGFDERVETVAGDVSNAELLRTLVDRDDVSVFHLASMVSGGAEVDFDGAMKVNLDGGRAVLEACRARGSRPRLVFTSSIAAFGGEAALGVVSDSTKLTPDTTYGTTKAICELLVNDYTRKGFVDGRSARLPTVVIRPGRPNAAASSWVSGVFREPLAGEECVVPVDIQTRVPLSGYRSIVDNLIRLHDVEAGAIGSDRGFNLPALSVTAQQMIDGLRAATDRPLGPISVRPDPVISGFYRGWAAQSSFAPATAIGLVRDEAIESIVREYIADFLLPSSPTA